MKTPFVPSAGDIRKVEFPQVEEVICNSGMTAYCLPDHGLPKVTILIGFPFGKAQDPEEIHGLGLATIEMLKEGTARFTSRQIAEQFDRLAIEYSADIMMEQTVLSLSLLEPHLQPGLELLAELMLRPSFPASELEKLLLRLKSVVLAQRADAGFLAAERLYQTVFAGHPYSRMTIRESHLEQITRPAIEAHFGSLIRRDSATPVLAGSVSLTSAKSLMDSALDNWRSPGIGLPTTTRPAITGPGKVVLVDRPDSAQTRIQIAFRGVERTNQDFLPLLVFNQVLGGSASARLFLRLREELGLTYGVYSSLHAFRHAGILSIGCSTHSEKAGESVREILTSVARLRDQGPADRELDRAKAELTGEFVRRLEAASSVGLMELNRRLIGLPQDYYSTFVPTITDLSAHDLMRVSQTSLGLDVAAIIAVGNAEEMRRQFDGLGEIEVVVGNGNGLREVKATSP